MKRIMRIAGIVVLVFLVFVVCAFAYWCFHNLHWWEKDMKRIEKLGVVERQVTLPNGNVINYGELKKDGPALLLVHGQMVSWEEYASVMPDLYENWHIYAIDVYGHGESSHKEELYYLDVNGDDIIWFIKNVIQKKTVVSGHSNGALTAAYAAAYGGNLIKGAVLEDPPVFSVQGEGWENSFAYLDTYKPLHDYISSEQTECWEAYYLRHCCWGELFMKESMPGIADYAQHYSEKHPGEEVKLFFMPASAVGTFHYIKKYDMMYGDHFYDLTWNNGIAHEKLLSDIEVPCIYLHAKEEQADNGIYLCAAAKEQAQRAVSLIGDNCQLIETKDSNHNIHGMHTRVYADAVNSFLQEGAE